MRKTIITAIYMVMVTTIIYSCQSADSMKQDMYYTNGRDLYIQHCQNCHGEKGEGLGELAPPLTDTVFMKDHKAQLACIIKNGLEGPVTVAGKVYNEKMPAETKMANIDIAQLIVYITNTFGNKQGMYTSEEVAANLNRCK
ncbi:c-type cytochrome [Pedobacter sp.]|uniref:c-type cytochrome n=1 Tax=Pedobacter sp. TaxID=1411316 RepID=UPI003D7FC82E